MLCSRAPARRLNRPGPAYSPDLGDVAVADLSGAENAQLVVRLRSFHEGRWTLVAGGAGGGEVTQARLSAILVGEEADHGVSYMRRLSPFLALAAASLAFGALTADAF